MVSKWFFVHPVSIRSARAVVQIFAQCAPRAVFAFMFVTEKLAITTRTCTHTHTANAREHRMCVVFSWGKCLVHARGTIKTEWVLCALAHSHRLGVKSPAADGTTVMFMCVCVAYSVWMDGVSSVQYARTQSIVTR